MRMRARASSNGEGLIASLKHVRCFASYLTLLLLLLSKLSAASSPLNQRDHFLLNLSYGRLPTSSQWPPLNSTEVASFSSKADNWLRHALRQGDAGHIQFGQVMPQVLYSDPNMTSPLKYDDVGDSAAWTGHLLAALVHKYYIDEDPTLLPYISEIINAWDFYTHNCTGMHGFVPRAWATPSPTSKPWAAFHNYFGANNPSLYNCSAQGNTNMVWQGGSSRDTYIGVLFGLGSTLMTLKHKPAALQQYTLAQTVFERIFDKLSSDLYFIVYPDTCTKANWKECVPVNPTPTFIAAYERVALFVNPAKYKNVQSHYNKWIKVALATESITPPGHSGYYANNLLSACWYIILRMETMVAGQHLTDIKTTFSKLLVQYRPHLQAPLNGYWVAATNDTTNVYDTLTKALLWDFPNPPAPETYVNQSSNTLYGPNVQCSEGCGCSTYAMLVRDRPPNEFVWQITPTKLESGAGSLPATTPKTEFGGAFLTPYWVWRTKGLF